MNGLFNLPEAEPVGEEIELPADATSLDFMQAIYRNPAQPMTRRMRAAVAALPFEHPKLAVTVNTDGNFASQMEDIGRRMRRSNVIDAGKKYDTSAPLKIADGRLPIETDPADQGRKR